MEEDEIVMPPGEVMMTVGSLNSNSNSSIDSDSKILDMLNQTVSGLQEKNMHVEALGCLEQSLFLKKKLFGVTSAVVRKTFKDVVLSYNSIAMNYLSSSRYEKSLGMLRKAEALTIPGTFQRTESLRVLTFNNIGCVYRRLGKLKVALKYLKEAADLGTCSHYVSNLSLTHLNICAIQSELGKHDLALEHAQSAVFHCQEELVTESHEKHDDDDNSVSELEDVLEPKSRDESLVSMAIAYHNLAVELEFTGKSDASLQWYKKALQLVRKQEDRNPELCEAFKAAFVKAKAAFEAKQSQHKEVSSTCRTRVRNVHPIKRPRRPGSANAASRRSSSRRRRQQQQHPKVEKAKQPIWRDDGRIPPAIEIGRVRPSSGRVKDKNAILYQGSPVRATLRNKGGRVTDDSKPPSRHSSSGRKKSRSENSRQPDSTTTVNHYSDDEKLSALTNKAQGCLQGLSQYLVKPADMSQLDYITHLKEATVDINSTLNSFQETSDAAVVDSSDIFSSSEDEEKEQDIFEDTVVMIEDHAALSSEVNDDDDDIFEDTVMDIPSDLIENAEKLSAAVVPEDIIKPVRSAEEIQRIRRLVTEEVVEIRFISARRLQAWIRGRLLASKTQVVGVAHTIAIPLVQKHKASQDEIVAEVAEIHNLASIRIQCAFRAFLTRQNASVENHMTEHLLALQLEQAQGIAAVLIQGLARGYLVRKITKTPSLNVKDKAIAATKIQAKVRARQAKFMYEAEMAGRHASATKLQAHYRGFNVRSKQELPAQYHEIHNVAATSIQSIVRRNSALVQFNTMREQQALHDLTREIAATTLQQSWKELRRKTPSLDAPKISITSSGPEAPPLRKRNDIDSLPQIVSEFYKRFADEFVDVTKQPDTYEVNQEVNLESLRSDLVNATDAKGIMSALNGMTAIIVNNNPSNVEFIELGFVLEEKIKQDEMLWEDPDIQQCAGWLLYEYLKK